MFYPWGFLESGYILPTEEKTKEVRSAFRKLNLLGLTLILGLQAVGGGWITLIFLPLFSFCYYVRVQVITRDMEKNKQHHFRPSV